MRTIIVTIISILFTMLTVVDTAQAKESGSNDVIVAENIIEAVNNIDIISLNVLLAEGAAIDTVDDAGNSPLILAAKIGNPRMIEIILAHKPEVNIRNNDGDTALMLASETGVLSIVQDLKQAGADPEMRNSAGYNSAQIAQRFGHGAIAQFLKSDNAVSFSR